MLGTVHRSSMHYILTVSLYLPYTIVLTMVATVYGNRHYGNRHPHKTIARPGLDCWHQTDMNRYAASSPQITMHCNHAGT